MLSNLELTHLVNYVDRIIYTNELINIINNHNSKFNNLYRGLKILKSEISIGNKYNHFNKVSSWTKDLSTAIDFSLYSDIHDDILHSVNNDESLFINVVFQWSNAYGLDVNKALSYDNYDKHIHEEEVLVCYNDMVISDITDCGNYYLVKIN
ncbi:hypothetical protein PQE75_gp019 [Bacillus phage vB_BcoS-136]|uniref:Uncharacterized protein n=1 Tax=Bacillus phage vB_BcoS-136 TaxID=2419619 RepID=A0A3G3BVH7_9CAUD|nr:hypothetical protein PQE75_gp019 [Bacillus phage vB_BcoS-136]AYP68151.1 hypothetical protein vBBcoS136_00019 [Bacillus phage vB_BcoS-136]